jgi:hypothetical protein
MYWLKKIDMNMYNLMEFRLYQIKDMNQTIFVMFIMVCCDIKLYSM